jgi:hypothetical protein
MAFVRKQLVTKGHGTPKVRPCQLEEIRWRLWYTPWNIHGIFPRVNGPLVIKRFLTNAIKEVSLIMTIS